MSHRFGIRPCFRAGLSRFRLNVPLPLEFAGFRRASLQISGNIEIVPADADDDVVFNDDRRNARKVILIEVTNLLPPPLFAFFQIQRYQMTIRRFEEQPVAEDSGAAIAYVIASLRLPGVMPDL